MVDAFELVRGEMGVQFLGDGQQEQEGAKNHFRRMCKVHAVRGYGLWHMLDSLRAVMEPPEHNFVEDRSAQVLWATDEAASAMPAAGPFYYGSILGWELANAHTSALLIPMCNVPLSVSLKDGRPLAQRLPKIREDLLDIGRAGYEEVPVFHEFINEIDQELRENTEMLPGFTEAGFGLVMHLMKEAHFMEQAKAVQQEAGTDWGAPYRWTGEEG